jgi:hypothetical protein
VIGRAFTAGRGFKGLAAYLRDGHLAEPNPERVAWIEARNLPTRDPAAAARLMAATARLSERVENPLYHFSVSFDPSDPVNRETMRRVADRTLRDLGLQEHQVLIVAHADRAHPHMHFMVNRVHPERGTAWSKAYDFRRIEQTMRAQEEELGFRYVPSPHVRTPDHMRERVGPAPARAVRGDADFLARVQREAGPVLERAGSWGEVEQGLGAHGLSVRVKGGGLVVTDGAQEVKASQIDRGVSRRALEGRFGPLGDYHARKAVADRALQDRAAQVERVAPQPPAPAEPQRATAPAPAPTAPVQLPLPLDVPAAPEQPTPSHATLLQLPLRRAVAPPSPAPRVVPTRAPDPIPQPLDAPAPAPAPQRPGPAVPPPQQPTRAPERLQPRTYGEAVREYYRATRALFADPPAARRAFLTAAASRGHAHAADALRQRPESFGALRPGATYGLASRAGDLGYVYARGQEQRMRPQLKAIAAPLLKVMPALDATDALRLAQQAEHARSTELRQVRDARANGLGAWTMFSRNAGEVYADPGAGVRALEAYRKQFGTERAAEALAKTPERFGGLRRSSVERLGGLVRWQSDGFARAGAPTLAAEYREAVRAFQGRPSEAVEALAAGRAAEAVRVRDAARAVRERLGPVDLQSLAREVSSRLRAASGGVPARQERLARGLRPMLPQAVAGVARTAFQIAREIDQDHEPGRRRDRGLSL